MKHEEMIINNNRIYWNGNFWVVESADGSWSGYELYDTEEEAVEAAQEDNDEDICD